MKNEIDPDPEKIPGPVKLPPDYPPVKPDIQPEPEKQEPFHPSPEHPVIPEPKIYPGKSNRFLAQRKNVLSLSAR